MDGSGLPETRSTCPYCGVGCGVLLRPDGQGGLAVRGDPDHPANQGRLCSKGIALGQTIGLEQRLLHPLINGQRAPWDTALDLVADKFRSAIETHGPDSVAFYVSGQLLTEDYYVANKLMKGFIGSANIDTNSRLCMASTVAGHKRAFGTDTVPGTYEDLEAADLVVLVGSNLAWCHPVLHQRLLAARAKRGTRIIVIDPRRTATCEGVDLHLPLAAGSDVALFNHLLKRIADRNMIDRAHLTHVSGLDAAVAAARDEDSSVTGLSAGDIESFCQLWIDTPRVVTVFSQGVNQSSSGSDKVNAILNCHLATGRIGKRGCGPLSVTGQPNAMGGREVGGLANTLACHLNIENEDHRDAVQRFWNAPRMPSRPGLMAVDLFRAVARRQIKALWIIHTNPAVSMPDATAVSTAISDCDFTVVSDVTLRSDTARLADVVLPATAWGEKEGTVTNSDRTISRQRAVFPAPGGARPDWAILAAVGQRMGWKDAFSYERPSEIFREHAALSGIAGRFGLDFDISDLRTLCDDTYAAFTPTRWPVSRQKTGGRFFKTGGYFHPDGKARMLAVKWRPPVARATKDLPFVLNTGRIRDQWHTMTRTGLSPSLSAHLAEPFVDIHPRDAHAFGISAADLVILSNPTGRVILRARITKGQVPGSLFAPIHWTAETGPSARIDQLVPSVTDPVSGQPESKATTVSASKFQARWYGFAVSQSEMSPRCAYWAKARTDAGWRAEFAGMNTVADWATEARGLFDLPEAALQIVEDESRGAVRLAFSVNRVLKAALFVSRRPVALMRDHVATLPGTEATDALTGRAPIGQVDPGPTVCACFGVGLNSILSAIEQGNLMTVEAVGQALQAGTNCGACRPELMALLHPSAELQAAE